MIVARYMFDPVSDRQVGETTDVDLVGVRSGELAVDQVGVHPQQWVGNGGLHSPTAGECGQAVRFHQPCDTLVVHRLCRRGGRGHTSRVVEFGGDALGAVVAVMGVEDDGDPGSQGRVVERAGAAGVAGPMSSICSRRTC